uniref:Uncharacterized protein n=1 Tax=Clostridium botulinum TaxID=1491 RepID=A0A126JIT9_CLOBO|nr:hypothetical protein [Clostridium botulinum]
MIPIYVLLSYCIRPVSSLHTSISLKSKISWLSKICLLNSSFCLSLKSLTPFVILLLLIDFLPSSFFLSLDLAASLNNKPPTTIIKIAHITNTIIPILYFPLLLK